MPMSYSTDSYPYISHADKIVDSMPEPNSNVVTKRPISEELYIQSSFQGIFIESEIQKSISEEKLRECLNDIYRYAINEWLTGEIENMNMNFNEGNDADSYYCVIDGDNHINEISFWGESVRERDLRMAFEDMISEMEKKGLLK